MKILVDFHHTSLLRSLIMLFEDRLGHEVYRPIGEDWFKEGFWQVYNHPDSVKQFLSYDQEFQPTDGTPALNKLVEDKEKEEGVYYCADPGDQTLNRACTLDYFKEHEFGLVIASIPPHTQSFSQLVDKYNHRAKLIYQIGNRGWAFDQAGFNILASVKPRTVQNANVMFYHQEFDTGLFAPSICLPTKKINGFINIMHTDQQGWTDFTTLERGMTHKGYDFKSYGGQCRDGAMQGPQALADKMREAEMIFHVKTHGDGYGHIIHNAFAVGRPVILRSSNLRGTLSEDLLTDDNHIDLDKLPGSGARKEIMRLSANPEALAEMGRKAGERFREVVDFEEEARRIKVWLEHLL